MNWLDFGDFDLNFKITEVEKLLIHGWGTSVFSENTVTSFSYVSYKIGFDTSCKWSPKEEICMKCQILFSRENKKKYLKMLSAEIFTQHAV